MKNNKTLLLCQQIFETTPNLQKLNNKMATARKEKQGTASVDKTTKTKDFRLNQWFILEVQGNKDMVTYQLVVIMEQGKLRNKLRF